MKFTLANLFRITNPSLNIMDTSVRVYLAASFVCLTVISFNLGLYSDDYWNLFEAKKHSGFTYFANHMTRINSRYTYALINKLMYLLFYDTDHMFAWLYIRSGRLLMLFCHFIGVWFVYRIMMLLRIPGVAVFCLLPFISFPVYGLQALLWLAAGYTYPVGFALFAAAVYFLLTKRYVLFAVLAFFSLGATEFVIVPALAVTGVYWVYGILACGDKAISRKTQMLNLLVLLSPFIAWFLIVALTPAAASRDSRVHGHPKLLVEPVKWLISYFTVYAKQLQPSVWMQEYWYVLAAFSALMIVAIKELKNKLLSLFLMSLYFFSILPLSAVGYDFRPIGHARVWYLPGIFFYIAVFSAIALALKRFPLLEKHSWIRTGCIISTLTFSIGFSFLFFIQIKDISKDGEKAYSCVRGFIETVERESNGKAPKRVDICGLPPSIYNFSVFRSPNGGPYALALLFDREKTIPFSSKKVCSKNWGKSWHYGLCSMDVRYKITMPATPVNKAQPRFDK